MCNWVRIACLALVLTLLIIWVSRLGGKQKVLPFLYIRNTCAICFSLRSLCKCFTVNTKVSSWASFKATNANLDTAKVTEAEIIFFDLCLNCLLNFSWLDDAHGHGTRSSRLNSSSCLKRSTGSGKFASSRICGAGTASSWAGLTWLLKFCKCSVAQVTCILPPGFFLFTVQHLRLGCLALFMDYGAWHPYLHLVNYQSS